MNLAIFQPIIDAARAAVKRGDEVGLWRRAAEACLAGYVTCYAAVFATNSYTLPVRIFDWWILPTGLLAGVKAILQVPPASTIFWAAFAYLLMVGIGSFADPLTTKQMIEWYARQSFLLIGFLLVTAVILRESPPQFYKVFFTLVPPIAAISAAVNMLEFAHSAPISSISDRLIAQFGSPGWRNATQIAPSYAVALVGAAGYLASFRTTRIQQLILGLSMSVLLLAIIWTEARGTWLAVSICALVLVALKDRAKLWMLTAGTAFALVALAAVPSLPPLFGRGSSLRFSVWKFYLHKAVDQPWLGYGMFDRIPFTPAPAIDQPHNLLLWGQICGGVFGALAVGGMLALSIYWAARYFRDKSDVTPLLLITTITVVGIFEVGLLTNQPDATWFTFWLPVAMCIGAETRLRWPSFAENCEQSESSVLTNSAHTSTPPI